MEIEINDFNENENGIDEVYKLDYDNQNFKNNVKYQEWKKFMIDKYGNNIKIFKCKNDRILFNFLIYLRKFKYLFLGNNIYTFTVFCIKDCELKKNISYFKECPKCKNLICYFCSYSSSEKDYIFCCLKRGISTHSNNASNLAKEDLGDNFLDFISFLIPGINFVGIFMLLSNIIYFNIATKKSKTNYNGKLKQPESEDKIKVILFGILLLYGLVYFFFNIFMIIFTLIITIPFKFYPIKYIYYLI